MQNPLFEKGRHLPAAPSTTGNQNSGDQDGINQMVPTRDLFKRPGGLTGDWVPKGDGEKMDRRQSDPGSDG